VVGRFAEEQPEKVIVADSRHGFRGFPPVIFKMNTAELGRFSEVRGQSSEVRSQKSEGRGQRAEYSVQELGAAALVLARRNDRPVFVTLAEHGILAASPNGEVEHVKAHRVRGEIDIVGAGDAVTANITAALAAGGSAREAIELANAAASVVIHQLGTTGAAGISQIKKLVCD
jgi:sugar/nucleoside kinase (ribokinase family)